MRESIAPGYDLKLCAALFIGHRCRPLYVAGGIRHQSDFLIGEEPRSFELHPLIT